MMAAHLVNKMGSWIEQERPPPPVQSSCTTTIDGGGGGGGGRPVSPGGTTSKHLAGSKEHQQHQQHQQHGAVGMGKGHKHKQGGGRRKHSGSVGSNCSPPANYQPLPGGKERRRRRTRREASR